MLHIDQVCHRSYLENRWTKIMFIELTNFDNFTFLSTCKTNVGLLSFPKG
jgi:hypothetical protein